MWFTHGAGTPERTELKIETLTQTVGYKASFLLTSEVICQVNMGRVCPSYRNVHVALHLGI